MNALQVLAKLKKKGQAMTLSRVDAASIIHDPITGSISYSVPQEFTVYGITTNYNIFTRMSASNDPNSLIRSGDKKALIAPGVVVPMSGDTLTIQGVPWIVIAVDTLNPQGVDLLYTCQVRM